MPPSVRPPGEFEQAVMLALLNLKDRAYGVAIRDALEARLERSVSLGAVYTTLDRLLAKGFVSTCVGQPTAERGGRAKKFFKLEPPGLDALRLARRASHSIWAIAPLPRPR